MRDKVRRPWWLWLFFPWALFLPLFLPLHYYLNRSIFLLRSKNSSNTVLMRARNVITLSITMPAYTFPHVGNLREAFGLGSWIFGSMRWSMEMYCSTASWLFAHCFHRWPNWYCIIFFIVSKLWTNCQCKKVFNTVGNNSVLLPDWFISYSHRVVFKLLVIECFSQ